MAEAGRRGDEEQPPHADEAAIEHGLDPVGGGLEAFVPAVERHGVMETEVLHPHRDEACVPHGAHDLAQHGDVPAREDVREGPRVTGSRALLADGVQQADPAGAQRGRDAPEEAGNERPAHVLEHADGHPAVVRSLDLAIVL